MIEFRNLSQEFPYKLFREFYDKSIRANQKSIEAICISSYSKKNNEVNARYVNLKLVHDKEFIFFSNYNSPKAHEFSEQNQINALIYWESINTQIRIKAHINKTSLEFNNSYFKKRDTKKNALAISSNQSSKISSYNDVKCNYEKALKESDLQKCPNYWGGYAFIPYSFEFWEGHDSRINLRNLYIRGNDEWEHSILQP